MLRNCTERNEFVKSFIRIGIYKYLGFRAVSRLDVVHDVNVDVVQDDALPVPPIIESDHLCFGSKTSENLTPDKMTIQKRTDTAPVMTYRTIL